MASRPLAILAKAGDPPHTGTRRPLSTPTAGKIPVTSVSGLGPASMDPVGAKVTEGGARVGKDLNQESVLATAGSNDKEQKTG